jgi:hypothetical protein
MHFWGYLSERLLTGDRRRTTRRSRGSSHVRKAFVRDERVWSRSALWQ